MEGWDDDSGGEARGEAGRQPKSGRGAKGRAKPGDRTGERVALVCDWLTEVGGAERVLKALSDLYPEAPIYTSQYRPKRIDWFVGRKVVTGWMNWMPARLRRFLGVFREWYFRGLDLSEFDVVISVTGAEAKGVKFGRGGVNGVKFRGGGVKNGRSGAGREGRGGAGREDEGREGAGREDERRRGGAEREGRGGARGEDAGRGDGARHICYCHVPTQYYWELYEEYLANPGFGILNPVARLGMRALVPSLRRRDWRAAQLPTQFVAISEYSREMILKHYGREAVVINPPVGVEKFGGGGGNIVKRNGEARESAVDEKSGSGGGNMIDGRGEKGEDVENFDDDLCRVDDFNVEKYVENLWKSQEKTVEKWAETPDVVVEKLWKSRGKVGGERGLKRVRGLHLINFSRQVTWKRLDVAIMACDLVGCRLTLIGEGPEQANLRRLAGRMRRPENFRFLPKMGQGELVEALKGADGFVFPSLEPFGIAPIEAMAAGVPVVAFGEGGARDFVTRENGVLFLEQSGEAMAAAILELAGREWSKEAIRRSVERFSEERFWREIRKLVEEV